MLVWRLGRLVVFLVREFVKGRENVLYNFVNLGFRIVFVME